MIYHFLAHSDDILCYLILRGKQKDKTKTHLNTECLPIFQIVGTIKIFITKYYINGTKVEKNNHDHLNLNL